LINYFAQLVDLEIQIVAQLGVVVHIVQFVEEALEFKNNKIK
jgi:hypothetical protein